MLDWPTKDPRADLDYEVDWSAWLDGDTIATSNWTVPNGITQHDNSKTSTTTTIWLQGGTAGETYQLVNEITTVAGRKDDRTVEIKIAGK